MQISQNSYQTGEIYYLWGKPYTLLVLPVEGRQKVVIEGSRLVLRTHISSTIEEREKIMANWYRKELEKRISSLMEKDIAIVGKSPVEWRIKNMKTRWGTCNVTRKRIWLNLQLAQKPVECLEYVIIHELTHLHVPNHGPEFKKLMTEFYPNWKKVKKLLDGSSQ